MAEAREQHKFSLLVDCDLDAVLLANAGNVFILFSSPVWVASIHHHCRPSHVLHAPCTAPPSCLWVDVTFADTGRQ